MLISTEPQHPWSMRTSVQERAVLGLQLSLLLAQLEKAGLLPRPEEILPSDTLVPAAQSRRALQFHGSCSSSMECTSFFTHKDEEMGGADWKGLCTPAWLCQVQGRRIFISLHFFQTKVS